MKILHISTQKKGGAANAAIRIHELLIRNGISSTFLSLEQSDLFVSNHVLYDGVYNTDDLVYPELTLKNLIKEKFFKSFSKSNNLKKLKQHEKYKFTTPLKNNEFSNFTLFSYPHTIYDITTSTAYKEADIIHLHWVANFIDYPSFFSKIDKPIVWTLHDENPYLGGFHYQDDVTRNLLTHGLKENEFANLKAFYIEKISKISIVSPSYWIANKARSSQVFKGKRVEVIRNTLDSNIFKPRDKFYSRDLFSLPQNKKIILVASHDLSIHRKGVSFVLDLINEKKLDKYFFVFAGSNLKINKTNVISLGSITDEILMSCLYSAADFFLLPSLLDNLPNTLLESLFCGTPVIAFKIGDFEQIFNENEIGVLVDKGDVDGLKSVLHSILINSINFDSHHIVQIANKLFSEIKTVNSYIKEYNLLIDE